VLNVEIEGETHSAPGETRNWIADFYPVFQGEEVFAVGACVREVTDQTMMVNKIKAQNDQQELLLGELQHRVKNTLATISSISKLLLKGSQDAADYQRRLADRLGAISRTHDLLTDADWTTATLAEIVQNEASPYQPGENQRVKLSGPDLRLTGKQALALGMAIHELMTNAAKYGALSVEDGHIDIKTSHIADEEKDLARIIWQERDGPKIKAEPDHKGFGSLVLERVLKTDLSGDVTIDYRQEGLHVEVDFKLEKTDE